MTEQVFRFLPGEKIMQAVGLPGPDTDDCEVVEDNGGPTVRIRFQVYGSGPFYEEERRRDRLLWYRGTPTSERYRQWKAEVGK